MTTLPPIRAALIGTGGIAGAHVRAFQAHAGRAQLVAAMDIDARRVQTFCDDYDIPGCYTDVGEMLAKEKPQLVNIATPPGTHCDLSIQCMEAGAWVLCEKPLCISLAEMDRIEAAERQTGNYTSSIFQYRFGSGGQHLKRLIDSQEMGRLLVATSMTVWLRTDEYYAVPWRGKWETESGGVTMIHGIHALDFLLWLAGEWREVRAMIGTLNHNIAVEDVSMASIRFASGVMANVTNSVNSPREESYMRFDFQKATVELTHLYSYRNANWRYSLPKGGDEADLARWQAIPEDVPSGHTAQLDAMLNAMAQGERPPVSGPDVRGTIEFLASLYKSAMTGQPVRRGSITPDDPFYHRMNGPGDQSWQQL
jgi:predicted dehydrogenase